VPTSTTTTLSDNRRDVTMRTQIETSRSSQALICRLVQEDASYAVKIGNGNSRNMRTDFISTSTAFVASPHHHLATSARSSPHLAFSGAATFVHQTQLRASSSAFCACVSTFLVDLEPLVRCVNGLTCVDRSASSRASKLQWTSRSAHGHHHPGDHGQVQHTPR
jgi:hypothetical protein